MNTRGKRKLLCGILFSVTFVLLGDRTKRYMNTMDKKGDVPAFVNLCHEINWSEPRYCSIQNGTIQMGNAFNLSSSYLETLGIPLKNFVSLDRQEVNDFVFVTAANNAYFYPAMDAIGNVQRLFPDHSIYFYDLEESRSQDQVIKIRNLCRVEYRKFNYSRYPPHVTQLKLYAFKPLVVHEMLLEFAGVFWIDSSVRFQTDNISSALDQVYANNGILTFARSYHSNFAVTHYGMYLFLPIPASAASITEQRDANSILFYRTQEVYTKAIVWWVLCALQEGCMAAGRQLGCNFKGKDVWAGCHRFDQSAINILLANHFNYDDLRYLSRDTVLVVSRGSQHVELLNVCFSKMKSASYFESA